ncbi:methyltransferase [Flavimobilis sp. GY10621]|uniref:Methyltransferase n=1 Tax=Flavimobilis rhizosphaerae TaxID=2775421 RepID=A0ABR9DMA4_9MICO|nr:methyltransferase [Flavimobilis rhizosphaerae]MBD9698271.1 methyltransferase [Flavimobilis rhizosphaerae]
MPHALPADVLAMLDVLRRRPDVEAPELVAADAADRLVLAEARELLASSGPGEVAVLDDGYGALALGALALGAPDVRVATDTVTSERAIRLNAAAVASCGLANDPSRVHPVTALDPASVSSLGLPVDPSCVHVTAPLDPASVAGARVVLARLPRSLDALAELTDLVADHAAPDVVLLATGRLKHMSRSMNDVLAVRFAEVSATLAHGKARALVARRPVAAPPGHVRFPRRARVEVPAGAGLDGDLDVVAHGAAFAGPNLDIGTRALVEVFDELVGSGAASGAASGLSPVQVLDLGCGTGVLATVVALRVPHATVVATDRSAAAVLSAAATAAANGVGDRVTTLHDDAAASVPDASVDVVVCNPPFHAGTVVSTDIAEAMFRAAARVLRPGGELWVVWNSHLRYRPSLERVVGPTTQVARTPKFTVTRSVRR